MYRGDQERATSHPRLSGATMTVLNRVEHTGRTAGSWASMTIEWTRRAHWHQIPEHVRNGIENLLGSPVRETADQVGGMSPGLAARVRCADGSRAFQRAQLDVVLAWLQRRTAGP